MALPNNISPVSPFDVILSETTNEMIENIESLADGTGFDSGAVPTAALAAGAVTPEKLLAGTGTTWAWTSFTPATTGWSGTPTTFGKHAQIGKTKYVKLFVNGTSNATTATITNLPAALINTTNADVQAYFRAIDNGSAGTSPGSAYIAPNSTTVQLFKDSAHGNWTGSGNKQVIGLLLIYEVA